MNYLAGGFNLPLSEKYDFVSWDEIIPKIWTNTIHAPNHQPVNI